MKLAAAVLLLILPCVVAAQESPADLIAAGKVLYEGRQYKEALAAYEQARAVAEAAGDSANVAYAKLGLAGLKTMYGELDAGVVLASEALATFEAAGNKPGQAAALQHLGHLHMGNGGYSEATGYFRRCASIAGDARKATCLERLGECEVNLGRYRQGMATLREAIATAIASNNRVAQASAFGAIGDLHLDQGNAELAVQYHEKSVAMFRELGNTIMVSVKLNNLGISYHLMGRPDRALDVYRENLALMEQLGYARGIAVSKMNIAGVLIDLHRDEEAAPILGELLPVLEGVDDPDSRANVLRHLARIEERRGDLSRALDYALKAAAERSDDAKDFYLGRALAGRLYRKLGRSDEARAALTAAIEAIESMHEQASGDEVHFFDERSGAYAEMAGLLIGEGRVEEALGYAERYRSRVLLDVLRRGPSGRSRDPRPPAAVSEIATALPREAALVEWLVTEEKTYVFVIAGGSIEVRAVGVDRDKLARRAETFRTLLADRRPDFREAARSLHQTLIAPIADLLAKRQSWILVPDGPLWNLSFQALLDRQGTYVAERAAIVYAPSIAAWMEMSRAPQAESGRDRRELLAFGNPMTPSAAGVEDRRGTLAPLPEAEAEVKSAARFYGADSAVYVRDQATEERFKAEAPRYRVLHVAGHGVLNDASPMHSYLLLAPGAGSTEDGYLEAGELMQLDLGADLVVLSACDTARGTYTAGEGIIGFSWALFAARCRTQVVSQWKVDSAATSVLMRSFHRNVRTDHTKAASALQKTVVSMLKTKEYRHPFYWAGFIVLGDGL
jgi:CHAT domain-containing protein/predicted negative regulator of RcsB-dependent stress response